MFSECLEVLLPRVPFGSYESPGEVLPTLRTWGTEVTMADERDTAVQDTCCHLILSFPGSYKRKLLRQRIHSLPVSAGGCAGSCRVPG